jgi:acyl-CoA thioesterase YciA
MTDAGPSRGREPALRTIAMPGDANPNGDIFGGWVVGQMDMAGGSVCVQRCHGRVATVSIEAMTFHEPVMIGDEFSCYATIRRIGRTSLTVDIEAWARRMKGGGAVRVTEGVFTYVAIDHNGRPRPVPPE